MNIEDILPELFGEKRVYYCQRCLNHGLREKRKNHKQLCLYRHCQCTDCIMVDRRRELNSRLMQIDCSSESGSSTENGTSGVLREQKESNDMQIPELSPGGGKMKERKPNCQRCAQHNVSNRLKGHKRACPFKECYCPKCQVVVERQKLMADQIKLRRRQKREKTMMTERDQTIVTGSIESTVAEQRSLDSSVCMKCTQQAFGYQQLLSLLDPLGNSDPLLTLSAILQACPHRENEGTEEENNQ